MIRACARAVAATAAMALIATNAVAAAIGVTVASLSQRAVASRGFAALRSSLLAS